MFYYTEAIECSKMHYFLSIGLLSSSSQAKYTLYASKFWTYVVRCFPGIAEILIHSECSWRSGNSLAPFPSEPAKTERPQNDRTGVLIR